jgi:hypothetical protein
MRWGDWFNKKNLMITPPEEGAFLLSPGEIHYLYWYIQGSIMVPPTRFRLRKAWGFCERHAWGAILVEASFRQGYMHGLAILYEDLLRPAIPAFRLKGPFKNRRLMKNLRAKGPCMMCDMGYGTESKSPASQELIERGRDASQLRILGQRTKAYWEKTICGRCLENGSWPRCRPHLIADAARGAIDHFSVQQALMEYVTEHIEKYSRSFRWEFRGTATHEDEAALLSAVGWCSGWQPLLRILGVKE